MQSGDALKAQAEFSEAVRLKPGYAGAHYNLALALHQEGKEDAAQAEFEKAYEISPELKNAPTHKAMKAIRYVSLMLLTPIVAFAVEVCQVTSPMATISIPHVKKAPELNTDTHSKTWSHASSACIVQDCSQQLDYPQLKTELRAFWTDSDLYLLFISPDDQLNLWL